MKNKWWFGPLLAMALSLGFAVGMATFLAYYKFKDAEADLARTNVALAAQSVLSSVQQSQSMGINLPSMSALPALLQRQSSVNAVIQSIRVTDADGKGIAASIPQPQGWSIPTAWLKAAALSGHKFWKIDLGSTKIVGWTLFNNFDRPIGQLVIEYSKQSEVAASHTVLETLLRSGAQAFGGAFVLGLLGVLLVFRRQAARASRWAGMAVIVGISMGALVFQMWVSIPLFSAQLLPELERSAVVLGASQAELLDKAVNDGIPLRQIYGVGAVMDDALRKNPSIAALAVVDADGKSLIERVSPRIESPPTAAAASAPIAMGGKVEVFVNADYARQIVLGLTMDMGIVMAVALFISLELLSYMPPGVEAKTDPLRPCRDVRAAGFLFFLSEELVRPYMPLFITSITGAQTLIPKQMLIGLLVAIFMLVVALAQPLMAAVTKRHGLRRTMLGGSAIAMLSYLGLSLVSSTGSFVLLRLFGALGYCAFFVGAQGKILASTHEKNRAAGLVMFAASILVAVVCGPSIGGILVENLGQRTLFLISASLIVASILLTLRSSETVPATSSQSSGTLIQGLGSLQRNSRFMALCAAAAVPANILLSGCAYFLLPMFIASQGSATSLSGRLLMVYGIMMVLLAPIAAALAERLSKREWFVLGGLALSAMGAMSFMFGHGLSSAIVLVLALGLGRALSINSTNTLVGTVAKQEVSKLGADVVYGVYRMIERFGTTLGPLIAGMLLAFMGFQQAFAVLGGLALLLAVIFYLVVVRQPIQAQIVEIDHAEA